MGRSDDLYKLPDDLPVPVDDGACDHLQGLALPSIGLPATTGEIVDISAVSSPWLVVYCYPHTGRPDREPQGKPGEWNAIPGARGCTPQSCAYRDHHAELRVRGATVYGLSTQDTEYQREAAERLHLPFPLLSDSRFEFIRALRLPTFEVVGVEYVRRLTIIARAGFIEKVFFPVFPPDADAEHVIKWLDSQPE